MSLKCFYLDSPAVLSSDPQKTTRYQEVAEGCVVVWSAVAVGYLHNSRVVLVHCVRLCVWIGGWWECVGACAGVGGWLLW